MALCKWFQCILGKRVGPVFGIGLRHLFPITLTTARLRGVVLRYMLYAQDQVLILRLCAEDPQDHPAINLASVKCRVN